MKNEVRIEILFNSIEQELLRRWAFGNVPDVYRTRPTDYLRASVKCWWSLYHETVSAKHIRNRSVWSRNPALPAHTLDNDALKGSLNEIYKLIEVDALSDFRPLTPAESSGVVLLAMTINYYCNESINEPTR